MVPWDRMALLVIHSPATWTLSFAPTPPPSPKLGRCDEDGTLSLHLSL